MNDASWRRHAAAAAAWLIALSLLPGCAGPEGSAGTTPTQAPTPAPTASATPSPTAPSPAAPSLPVPTDPAAAASPSPSRDPENDPQAEDLDEHGGTTDKEVTSSSHSSRGYSEARYESVVKQVLDKILKEEMTPLQQCRAIYDYVKGHISYTGSSDKGDWKKGAYSGFVTGRGDCYTYYACCRALLTALEIDNQEVQRYGSSMPTRHYWNLVDYGEGWYHMDACPHLKTDPAFLCFMATDQELLNFSAGCGREYYYFDAGAYPERVGGPADPDKVVPMPSRKPKPTPTPEPTQEPGAEPTPEPGSEPTPEPGSEPTPELGSETTPEPGSEPTPEPGTEPTPEGIPLYTPLPEGTAPPGAEVEPPPADTPGLAPVQTPEPAPEPTSAPGEEEHAQ